MNAVKIGFAVVVAMVASAGAASAQQAQPAQPVLKVATNSAPSPLGGFDQKAKDFDGMAVEFLRLIAKDMKIEIEFVAVPRGEQLAALTGKKVDIIASGEFVPAADGAVEKLADFSNVYASFRDVLLVKSSNKTIFRTPADLKGMDLAIVKGTDPAGELPKAGAKVKPYDTSRELLAAIEAGAVDGAILSSYIANEALKNNAHPEVMVVYDYTPTVGKAELAYLVQKGNAPFLVAMNDAIQKVLFEKRGNKIAYKWGVSIETSFLSEPCICAGP